MADVHTDKPVAESPADSPDAQLERGSYEIIRGRLTSHAAELRGRLEQLNQARRDVFGSIETRLLASERITTENNCVPRDIVALGDRFVFGYNVHIGLKSETALSDVFAVQSYRDGAFHEEDLDLISDPTFLSEFRQLYKYYKNTTFAKFFLKDPFVYMVFRVGKSTSDIKAFKWLREGDRLRYVDSRSDHEVRYPAQHEFEWIRTHRDLHRPGIHPHISIEDRVFVETVGGDLTIKVEDNTDEGQGIYSEPVTDPDQTLDDAEIFYAIVDNIVLLKIRPYQEEAFRYLVYNGKVRTAQRLDAIEESCVLLPEGHGLIFSNGYYLQSGESQTFDSQSRDLLFERRLAAPNGEDYLYVFYNRESGTYVLLLYNLIEQRVATPIVCNGFLLFENGQLVFFKSGDRPQKHHVLQIWQTPFAQEVLAGEERKDSLLFKIGNQDIVRAMAECHEIVGLSSRDDSYANLYLDLVDRTGDVLGTYFWLNEPDAFRLSQPLQEIRGAANAAVDEFDKVVRVRQATRTQFEQTSRDATDTIKSVQSRRYQAIQDYVDSLSRLRRLRGHVISLRDLRYVDLKAVEGLETEIVQQTERLSRHAVEFLVRDDALQPYHAQVETLRNAVDDLVTVAESKKLEKELDGRSQELEMLIDVVSNLKIDDATQRTGIIDNVSAVFSKLNQARSALKSHTKQLMVQEGEAEFDSQIKLLGQSVVNYLDVCDAPEKCDEYLTKIMVQIEELEGRFAEFDEFVLALSEKREEVYSAFDGRKMALVEARNRRANTLSNAAQRILKGIETRVAGLEEVDDIHSYFASDLMVEKVRDVIRELTELRDTVKVDDIESRLKTIQQDAIRQLKDRQDLYGDGDNTIQLGRHRFSVNSQPLDLTTVINDGQMFFHLTGTNFMEQVTDPEINDCRDLWNQVVPSENESVYRAEYLAFQMFQAICGTGSSDDSQLPDGEALLAMDHAGQLAAVQQFMARRHAEGYAKGIHDHDATAILCQLLQLHRDLGQLRVPAAARALAIVFHHSRTQAGDAALTRLERQLRSLGDVARAAHQDAAATVAARDADKQGLSGAVRECRDALHSMLDEFVAGRPERSPWSEPAAAYLVDRMLQGGPWPVSSDALAAEGEFRKYLKRQHLERDFQESLRRLGKDEKNAPPGDQLQVIRSWLDVFNRQRDEPYDGALLDEAAAVLFLDGAPTAGRDGTAEQTIEGMMGEHARIQHKQYVLNYYEFCRRLEEFSRVVVPQYEAFVTRKRDVMHRRRDELRLGEFKPRVLTSFVRNRLINDVYLPMIGDNLAKQIGVAGDQKRTDLMGMLLLVSPPGYGKTTLMEYVANRVGLTFVKINGPAIGHQVTSLDPEEAPHASAREEIQKLNLALEMGDNVMIYVDDIQHTNPEFLQKFISLCDAQRKIEGVYRGQTRTYDLRGRKVVVVMAGNPYTESGQKFQIPDMLASRADTYNLGDVIGGNRAAFELSYLENALTSNPTLGPLAQRSQRDVYAVLDMSQQEDGNPPELEGTYTTDQLNEFVAVIRRLYQVRDVLLSVNDEYIRSAAQADEYRTEPAFKLQGSYRDMNKIAERVSPIMNDEELDVLIDSHYENQAQTLTSAAEANLLKLQSMRDRLTAEQARRWEDIQQTFQRNLLLGSVSDDSQLGQVIAQMTTFSDGLRGIQKVLQSGMDQFADAGSDRDDPSLTTALDQLSSFSGHLEGIQTALVDGVEKMNQTGGESNPQQIQVVYRVPRTFLDVIKAQFAIMQTWLEPVVQLANHSQLDTRSLTESINEAFGRYESLIKQLESAGAKKQKKKSGKSR